MTKPSEEKDITKQQRRRLTKRRINGPPPKPPPEPPPGPPGYPGLPPKQ